MKKWESPDPIVFGPDRPFREYDDTEVRWADDSPFRRFVIDTESPDYAD